MIKTTFIPEFQITKKDSLAISNLIQAYFPEVDYKGGDYFKQSPHYRILVKEKGALGKQLGF